LKSIAANPIFASPNKSMIIFERGEMKKYFILLLIVIALAGCSKDDDPVTTEDPMLKYAGSYSGTTSQDTTCTFTITNVNSKAYLTAYSVSYKFNVVSNSVKGTESKSNSEGIVQISESKFGYQPDSGDANYFITGNFTSEGILTGSFSIKTISGIGGAVTYTSGTFTAQKNKKN
jgi:hypothetical protein